MTLQEAIKFLEDLQPDVCENCTMIETCNNAGTGICVEALNIIKAEAQRATYLQAKIDSSVLDRLRAENAKLHEVMELAFEDLQLFDICDYCLNRNTKEDCDRKCEKCQDVCFCINCTHGTRWQWQHADKLNEIKTINTTNQL